MELMARQVEQARAQEEKEIRLRQEKAKKMLVEVATANEIAKTLKEKKIQEEKEHDEAIFKYNKEKELQEF